MVTFYVVLVTQEKKYLVDFVATCVLYQGFLLVFAFHFYSACFCWCFVTEGFLLSSEIMIMLVGK